MYLKLYNDCFPQFESSKPILENEGPCDKANKKVWAVSRYFLEAYMLPFLPESWNEKLSSEYISIKYSVPNMYVYFTQ